MKSLFSGLAAAVRNGTPIPFSSRAFSFPWIPQRGQERQLKTMGSVGTLFGIVNRTSNATAQVEWCLYRKSASGDPEKRTKITRHAALDLWNKPNPFMPRQEFVETCQQHVDLTGEGWWVVGTDPRAPTLPLSLWPVRPDRMAPIPDAEKFISHYEYTGPNGERVRLELNEVVFLRMPNPEDPFRGMGPVQSILTDLDATRYSAEWNRNFFINGAEPGGIIEVEKKLTDPEFDELQDRWEEQHKGVSNAGRVAILEGGMKWVDRKFTNRDMQFVELREVNRDTILEAFGFPEFMLGILEDANRASSTASKEFFAEYLTTPRLERFKAALNNDLLPLFGDPTLEFDYEDPKPADREADALELTAKADAASKLVQAGWSDVDVLESVGLPKMEFKKPEPAATPPPPGEEQVPPGPPSARRLTRNFIDPKGFRAQLDDETDALIQSAADQMQADWDDQLERLLIAWDEITNAQRAELVEQVRSAVESDDVDALADLIASTDAASTLLQAHMLAMAIIAANQIVQEAAAQGVEVEPVEPGEDEMGAVALAIVLLLAAGLATSVGREAIRVWGPSSTADDVARMIDDYIANLSDRALRDQLGGALTNAQNRARFATMLTAPSATWYASERNDRNACGPCRDIDDRQFASLADAFLAYPNGGYVHCEGGIRCRGGVIPVWEVN